MNGGNQNSMVRSVWSVGTVCSCPGMLDGLNRMQRTNTCSSMHCISSQACAAMHTVAAAPIDPALLAA